MISNRSWADYDISYRSPQMEILARWIKNGRSCSVIGPSGSGRSNLLGFLANRPDALKKHLGDKAQHVIILSIDLNTLPAVDLATFYRVILRGFYEVRYRFGEELKDKVTTIYLENRAANDPFLPQSGLRELLLYCQQRQMRIVLIMDRFHKFRQEMNSRIIDTLRGLRDGFKNTLCYIIGTRQEVRYMANPEQLGELFEILDIHLCWVGPMNETDAKAVIGQETAVANTPPKEADYEALFAITGGYPALLKSCCAWWVETAVRSPQPNDWIPHLLADKSTQFRLQELWQGLSEAEKMVLVEIGRQQTNHSAKAIERWHKVAATEGEHISRLREKELIVTKDDTPQIVGQLLLAHVEAVSASVLGRLSYDKTNKQIYQGRQQLSLSKKPFLILKYMLNHPERDISHDELREAGWATGNEEEDDLYNLMETINVASIYQVIRTLRSILQESDNSRRYIVSGSRAETYIFYPNGRPA